MADIIIGHESDLTLQKVQLGVDPRRIQRCIYQVTNIWRHLLSQSTTVFHPYANLNIKI
jgi:hypothetical protein